MRKTGSIFVLLALTAACSSEPRLFGKWEQVEGNAGVEFIEGDTVIFHGVDQDLTFDYELLESVDGYKIKVDTWPLDLIYTVEQKGSALTLIGTDNSEISFKKTKEFSFE